MQHTLAQWISISVSGNLDLKIDMGRGGAAGFVPHETEVNMANYRTLSESVTWRLVRLLQIASRYDVSAGALRPLTEAFSACSEKLDAAENDSVSATEAVNRLLESVEDMRSTGFGSEVRCCMATLAAFEAWASDCKDLIGEASLRHGLPISD